MMGKGTNLLPLPGGERIEVRGLDRVENLHSSNALTLPSTRRGEGEKFPC